MPLGSYMLTTMEQSLLLVFVSILADIWESVQCEHKLELHQMYTLCYFLFSRPQLADSSLYKRNNHLLTTSDFKASECMFCWRNHSEPNGLQVYELRLLGAHIYPLCYSSSQDRFLSLYFSLLVSISSNHKKHSVIFKYTGPNLFTSKYQIFDNKGKIHFSQTHKIWDRNFFQMWNLKNTHFTFLLLQASFQHAFLLNSLSSPYFVCPPIPSPAPTSVRFLSLVELNKRQHCKIHMMSSGNVGTRK